jgi:hypothetical protein
MGRNKAPDQQELKYKLTTRVNVQKYEELRRLLDRNSKLDMSGLIRSILNNRPVKVIVKDRSLDNLMEELARLRGEIRSIGVNINQITRHFNTYPEPNRKALYAKIAFQKYTLIEPKIDELLEIIAKLAKKWLSA